MLTFARCRLHFRSTHHRVIRLSPVESLLEFMLTYIIQKKSRQRGYPSVFSLAMFLSVCLLWLNSTGRRLSWSIAKHILHMFVIHQIRNDHTEWPRREREWKREERKPKMWSHNIFPIALFMCLYFQKATHTSPRREKPVSNWHLFMDFSSARKKFLQKKSVWMSSVIQRPLKQKQLFGNSLLWLVPLLHFSLPFLTFILQIKPFPSSIQHFHQLKYHINSRASFHGWVYDLQRLCVLRFISWRVNSSLVCRASELMSWTPLHLRRLLLMQRNTWWPLPYLLWCQLTNLPTVS